MKIKLLLYFSIALSLLVNAERGIDTNIASAKIDSLEDILFNSLAYDLNTNEKITICIDLAELYTDKSFEKQIEYAARSLILAEEQGDNINIAKSLKILANGYLRLDNYDKGIEYSTRLYNIYNTNNDEINAAQALRQIGLCYYGSSKYIKALDYYERALDIFKENQYFEGIAIALQGIASVKLHWSNYDEALIKNQDALKFWEEIGDEAGIAGAYNNIGMVYQEIGNYERAYEYFLKSLETYKKLGRTWNVVNMTLHIGDIYLKKELYNKALEYYFKAELIGKQINNKKLKSIALSNIGEAYNLKGNYNKALDYQMEALKLKEEIGDKKRLAITYTELGIIYDNIGDYNKALNYLNKGLETALEINYKSQVNKTYKCLSNSYKNLGDYKKALENYQLYIQVKNEIFSEENTNTIAELQAKYYVEKKDKENERLRHSDQLSKSQIRNQQLIIGFVLLILLGSFILSTLFHSRYQQNQKLNVQLSLKNKEVENHQKKVEILNTELKEANAAKDKFFSIVAHDLKNPFNSLLGLSDILLEDYDNLTEDERKQFVYQIKGSAENTYSLLQNLLEWASAQSGKTSMVKEKIDISKISKEAISLLTPTAENKKIKIFSNIPENTYVLGDKNMVSTILINLVSNAVKFTPQKGKIEIHSIQKNSHLEIEVADTGVGISSENIDKLFRLDQKLQTEGTKREKGTGFGLILCKEFVEKNDGKIWVNSKVGQGSQFFFSLPVNS